MGIWIALVVLDVELADRVGVRRDLAELRATEQRRGIGARAAHVIANELDRATAREVAAIEPREHARHEAVVDELPCRLARGVAHADDQAARA